VSILAAMDKLEVGLRLGLGPGVMVRVAVQVTILFPENSLWQATKLEVLKIKKKSRCQLLLVAIIFATLQSKHRHKHAGNISYMSAIKNVPAVNKVECIVHTRK